MKRQN